MANKFRFRSIRKKLFFQAIIGVIIFAIIAIILNVFVMKPFYISQKKNTMLNSLEDISSLNLEKLNNERAFSEIRKIERQYDITIYWFDHDGEIIYLSNQAFINANGSGGAFSPNQPGRGIGLMNPNIRPNPIYIDENTVIYETNDDPNKKNQGFQNSEMVLISTLGDDSEIILRYRLKSFGDAIGLFNMFLLGAAGISIIISVFLSLFMARRFTEPIFEMNKAAKAWQTMIFPKLVMLIQAMNCSSYLVASIH